MKENETLQATVNSLKVSRRQKPSDDEDGGEGADGGSRDSRSRELERLTNSMTELMQEKKLLQSAAIAERKLLKQEYEERLRTLESELEEAVNEKTKFSQQVVEVFNGVVNVFQFAIGFCVDHIFLFS